MIGLIKALLGKNGDSVSPQEAAHRAHKGAWLIDVRETSEYTTGHAVGAKHLPLSHIRRTGPLALEMLLSDGKIHEVLLICEHGLRSRIAQGLMKSDTKHQYVNVKGGMKAWRDGNLPMERIEPP